MKLKRLEKLADALMVLSENENFTFDFSDWYDTDLDCGTCGCAIGYCPTVFPKHWEIVGNMPILKNIENEVNFGVVDYSGREFFGLSMSQFDHLFIGGLQSPSLFGGRMLTRNSRATSVAKNIYAFIKRMKK